MAGKSRRGRLRETDGKEERIDKSGCENWDGGGQGGQDGAQIRESGRDGEERASRYFEASGIAEEAACEDNEETAACVALMRERRIAFAKVSFRGGALLALLFS